MKLRHIFDISIYYVQWQIQRGVQMLELPFVGAINDFEWGHVVGPLPLLSWVRNPFFKMTESAPDVCLFCLHIVVNIMESCMKIMHVRGLVSYKSGFIHSVPKEEMLVTSHEIDIYSNL